MGVDRIDVAFIHDVSEDQWGPQWTEYFKQAMRGAAKALTQMREEGMIRGWGLGVNLVEPCRMALEQSDPDVFLLAGRYSLLDQREALDTLFARCVERGVGIVVGGPFNSGVLAGGEHYDYAQAPDEIRQKTQQIEAVCQQFDVDIRAAALQFCLAHPAVLAAIPGTSNPKRPAQYVQQFEAKIPADFWQALKANQLLPEDVPVPV